MRASGSINLATVRSFSGTTPRDGAFSIQMLSANLSGNTTFSLQYSLDGENWANAKSNGEDVTGTLVDDTTYFNSYEADTSIFFRILFAGVTTGTVDYMYT